MNLFIYFSGVCVNGKINIQLIFMKTTIYALSQKKF